MLASRTSTIWLAERPTMPTKTETCCDIKNVAKVTPKMSPKNLTRSPINMRMATQFMNRPLPHAISTGHEYVTSLNDDSSNCSQKNLRAAFAELCELRRKDLALHLL